jgi:hypothetical protein
MERVAGLSCEVGLWLAGSASSSDDARSLAAASRERRGNAHWRVRGVDIDRLVHTEIKLPITFHVIAYLWLTRLRTCTLIVTAGSRARFMIGVDTKSSITTKSSHALIVVTTSRPTTI